MKTKTKKDPAAVSLGRRGGQSKSAKKVAAAKDNGALGGRPRKSTATPTKP